MSSGQLQRTTTRGSTPLIALKRVGISSRTDASAFWDLAQVHAVGLPTFNRPCVTFSQRVGCGQITYFISQLCFCLRTEHKKINGGCLLPRWHLVYCAKQSGSVESRHQRDVSCGNRVILGLGPSARTLALNLALCYISSLWWSRRGARVSTNIISFLFNSNSNCISILID